MTFEVRLIVLALAAFAGGGLAGALAVSWFARRVRGAGPRARAAALMAVRLMPSVLSLAAATLVGAAFLVFEPRDRIETTGVLLQSLAGVAVALIAAAGLRWLVVLHATRRLARRFLADAEPATFHGLRAPAFVISSPFPIVGVVGLFRPRLIVARSVIDACTPEEMRVILAHEQGHIDRRDNLRRALLMASPDVLGWLPVSQRLQTAWHASTEEAADDLAGRSATGGRLHLAQALLKVARLAPAGFETHDVPASALYRGGSVARRVRRLLAAERPDTPRRAAVRLALAAGALAVSVVSLELIYLLVEGAVHGLP